MSLAVIPIEKVRKQCAAQQRKYWFEDKDKVDKMISWIEAIPNWEGDGELKYEHEMCLSDKQE
jgi:hypothetical protein